MVQYFTQKGLDKLKEELEYLKKVENPKIKKLIAEAAAFGDLKENSAYHDARDKMSWLRQRMSELEIAINEAIVKEKTTSDVVQVGSKIKILFGKDESIYEIVAPGEADILKNKLSYQSPLGQMIINRRVGDEFDFRDAKVKIIEIE